MISPSHWGEAFSLKIRRGGSSGITRSHVALPFKDNSFLGRLTRTGPLLVLPAVLPMPPCRSRVRSAISSSAARHGRQTLSLLTIMFDV